MKPEDMVIEIDGKTMYKCPLCSKDYKMPHNMVQHIQRDHGYTNNQLQDLYDELFLNGVRPKCKFHDCKNDAKFQTFIRGYRECCNRGHAAGYTNYLRTGNWSSLHNPDVEEKVKKTMNERYPDGIPQRDPKVIEKTKQTCLEKYGVENPCQNDAIKEKIINTNIQRYGGRSSLCDPTVRTKSYTTCIEKYGTPYCGQAEIVKQHIRESVARKYGPEYKSPLQVPEIKEKIAQSFLERYGGKGPMCSKEVMRKRNETLKRLTGGKTGNQAIPEVKRKTQITKRLSKGETSYLNFLRHLEFCGLEPLFTRDDYYQCNILKAKCKICGQVQESETTSGLKSCCQRFSSIEFVIKNILDARKICYTSYDRSHLDNQEIDFLINGNLGIECNGIWWHSENSGTPSDYHLIKTEKCCEQGITLLHFWEPEILEKTKIVESMITSRLHLNTKYRASDLVFKQIDIARSNNFMKDNHIQGSAKGVKFAFALLDKDDNIINCVQFSNRRAIFGFTSKDDTVCELVRSASKIGTNVYGGFTKLLKNSIPILKANGKKVIETYCDRRFSPIAENTVYAKNGFELIETTKPSYWYYDYTSVKHRYTYTKSALVKMFKDEVKDIEDKTESQIAKEVHLLKLWDCGQFKFSLNLAD